MSNYGRVLGNLVSSASMTTARRAVATVRQEKKMKISLKQRLINWLSDDIDHSDMAETPIERESLQSEGMRFQLYRASGGYVIETTQYDNRTDRRINKMYVITEDKDLGAELGKIITMEALRA